jgi:hypothetical protein
MRRVIIFGVVALLALAALAPAAVAAEPGNFDLTVKHRINGEPLGLDRELPVDIYVNGAKAIPGFELSDTVKTELPGGTYTVMVKLAGTDITVLSLGPVEIPAGAQVEIIAKRTGAPGLDGIGLKVKVG